MRVFDLRRLLASAIRSAGLGDAHGREPAPALDGAEAAEASGELPRLEAAYGHGVRDGRKQLDQDSFSAYLDGSVHERALGRELDTLHERRRSLAAEQAEHRERRSNREVVRIELDHLRESENRVCARLDELEHDLEVIEDERSATFKQGSLVYFGLFLAAAAVFILADVVITREIVADALGLTGRLFLGLDESWFFAVGLALVPVLLKPGYDRLIEDPWWEGRRGPFTFTIVLASAFAVATLAVLGIYRSVAHDVRTRLDLVLSDPRLDPAERAAALEGLEGSLLGTPWGTWAFILSGILFAIAGAICLGIALRHGRDFWGVKVPLFLRRVMLRRARRRAERDRNGVLTSIARNKVELARLEAELAEAVPERLSGQIQEVRAQEAELSRRLADAQRDSVRALYINGYAMGTELGEAERARRPPRPFVAVRQAIWHATAPNGAAETHGETSP